MERDSSVKRLDFEDCSLTVPGALSAEAVAPAARWEGCDDTGSVSGAAPSSGSFLDLPDDCSIAELRLEAQRIRTNVTKVDTFVNDFLHPFQQKVNAEAEAEQASVKQLQKLYSTLEAESFDLTAKEEFLKRLAEWKIGDENTDDEICLTTDSGADPDKMGDELTALKNANAETIQEIESLIRTIASGVNGLEADLSNESSALESFDLEVEKLAAEDDSLARRGNAANGNLSILCKQSESVEDLESTIRKLEETLRQNEQEYVEAEAAMESRIEQYNLEIEELQAQASQLDREEECMRMLIDVTTRFLQSRKHLECSSDVSVVSMENGSIELRLTTYVPTFDDPTDETDQASDTMWEHDLHIKINQETMEVQEAKLAPDDVTIGDLVSTAQETRVTTASLETVQDGDIAQFGQQVNFLVRAVHRRLAVRAFDVAAVNSASSDPRYSLERIPGTSLVTITKPGKLKALVELPENWPTPGFSPRLQSLQLLDVQPTDAASAEESMKVAVEAANKLPEYIRHDLLTFMQAIERITSE